jgi:hypothetical protein
MHARYERRLSEYLDGALTGRAKAKLEGHLERCAECRRTLSELRGTLQLLRSLPEEEAPEFLATRVLARIEAGEAAPTWSDRLRSFVATAMSGSWAPAFGAVALLFVVASLLQVRIVFTLPEWLVGAPPAEVASAAAPALADASPRFSLPEELKLEGPAFPRSAPTTPVGDRRRFDPVALEEVSGVHRACAASPHDAECREFRATLVETALANPQRFVREIDTVPLESRDRVIHAVSQEAARSGQFETVIYRLRRVDDPRAVGIIVRFQRTVASRE